MKWKCNYCQQVLDLPSTSLNLHCPKCGKKNTFEQTDPSGNVLQPERNICPVCSTEIRSTDKTIVCPDCKMIYHEDCWNDNNGCATYGCKSAGCLNPPPMKVEIQEGFANSYASSNVPPPYASNQTTEGAKCPFCHTKLALGTQICWACGREVPETENVSSSQAPGPWTRWVARQIDYLIESSIIIVVFSIIGIFGANTQEIVIGIVVGPFVFLLDSAVYAVFGNTLGKWLMGIMVIKDNGVKVNGSDYFKRNMRVYWGGFGLCIPIATFFTTITQYNRVNKKEETTYDELLHMKSIRHNSNALKSFFGVVLIILIFMGLAALSAAAKA